MTTVTFIGAGSTIFTRNLCGDILQRAALAGSTIRLMDIDPKRLEESELVVRKLIRTLDAPATVETSLEQRRALEGADFVVVSFQIGGYRPCTVTDFEVPKKFGLRQTIGDTLGVGGIMRGLRTVPPNINVQELTVAALLQEKREHIFHAAMLDPHTAAELDLDQIWSLVEDLLAAYGDWMPAFARAGDPSDIRMESAG